MKDLSGYFLGVASYKSMSKLDGVMFKHTHVLDHQMSYKQKVYQGAHNCEGNHRSKCPDIANHDEEKIQTYLVTLAMVLIMEVKLPKMISGQNTCDWSSYLSVFELEWIKEISEEKFLSSTAAFQSV